MASNMISGRAHSKAFLAAFVSAIPRSSICVVMTDLSAVAKNPPPCRTIRAAFEAAAITDGSSTAMGINRSIPLTWKFSARPRGKA